MKRTMMAMLVLAAGNANAGTVITANLPANTVIANIDSRADGAGNYNGDQSLWYQPFTTVTATLSAGTYTFRIVDPADTGELFPSLTSDQLAQVYTGWTYNSPWITNYVVFDSSAAHDGSQAQLLYGAISTQGFGNPQDAYNASVVSGAFNTFTIGSTHNTPVKQITFDHEVTLLFAIPDYGVYDNNGGVSVLVQPVTSLCAADFNGDGFVDFFDFNDFVTCFEGDGCPEGRNADYDGDGTVDIFDFNAFVSDFEVGC